MHMSHIDHLKKMAYSRLSNYIVPGLSSSLIGEGDFGKVRLFSASREQFAHITPHSHRFDFQCLVLQGDGNKRNLADRREDASGEKFVMTELTYKGKPGEYSRKEKGVVSCVVKRRDYGRGEWYGMTRDQVHPIVFSHDAQVLSFEGPELTEKSLILEPYVDGERVPTFKVEDWMFKKNKLLKAE